MVITISGCIEVILLVNNIATDITFQEHDNVSVVINENTNKNLPSNDHHEMYLVVFKFFKKQKK